MKSLIVLFMTTVFIVAVLSWDAYSADDSALDELVPRTFTLEHVDVEDILYEVRDGVDPRGKLKGYVSRNTILVVSTSENLDEISIRATITPRKLNKPIIEGATVGTGVI